MRIADDGHGRQNFGFTIIGERVQHSECARVVGVVTEVGVEDDRDAARTFARVGRRLGCWGLRRRLGWAAGRVGAGSSCAQPTRATKLKRRIGLNNA